MPRLGRRNALKLVSGSFALASLPWSRVTAAATPNGELTFSDGTLSLSFDKALRCSVGLRDRSLTPFDSSEALLLETGALEDFRLASNDAQDVQLPGHDQARRHVVTGNSRNGVEKRVEVTFFRQLPGFAVLQVHYRNNGPTPLTVIGWRNAAHTLADAPGGFLGFSRA